MCNLYGHKIARWEYNEYFKSQDDWRSPLTVEKDYSAPGTPGWVVRDLDGQRLLSAMRWGFPTRTPRKRPPKEGQSPYIIEWWTNARNLAGNMWRPYVADPAQRCLVPFTRFSEPKSIADRTGPGDNQWWFGLVDAPIGAFAGIWKQDPELGPVYSFLTCAPNPLIAPVHPKAMPVILQPDDYGRWLHGSNEEALALQAPFPSQLMSIIKNA